MRRGFTLIELLVAITILSLATTIVFQAFVTVTSTTEIARTEASLLRERQYIQRNFSENMASIYSDAACQVAEYTLLGEDNSGPAGPGDMLSFCTSLPMSGSGALPGQMRGVTYEVVGPEDADADAPTAGFSIDPTSEDFAPAYLVITERPVTLEGDGVSVEDDEEEEMVKVRQVPITSMDILYYDAESEEWVDDWDSATEERLPWAINVLITLARTQDDEANLDADPSEPDLDMTFVLPLGAGTVDKFIDPNHYYLSPGATDADSIFNKDRERPKK